MVTDRFRNTDFCYAEKITHYQVIDNGIKLSMEDKKERRINAQIQIVADNIVRIRVSARECTKPEPDFVNHSFLPAAVHAKTEEDDTCIRISSRCCRVELGKAPFAFTVYDNSGKAVYVENMNDVNPVGEGEDRKMSLGYAFQTDGDVACMNFCAQLRPDEHIYGLGERFTEFDKRGQKIAMWNYDTLGCRDETAYKNIPFFVSTYGYGLFINSHQAAEFNIGSESLSSISAHCPGDAMEYYIITGYMKEIVSTFTNLTGPAVLPPDWSFGLWFSTGFAGTDSKAVEADAMKFRELGIPCDVFHFDCYWLREDMWCDFIWDDAMYPDRLQMLRQMKKWGYKICLWINPYVTIKTEMYAEGREKGYFVKNSEGEPYLSDLWHGLLSICAILDVTNPQAVSWFKSKLNSILLEGVDVLKTDFGENIPEDCVFYNSETGSMMRNYYSILYNTIVFDTIKRMNGERNGIVWARSGFTGMQKYPVCWSGDPLSSFEGMAATLRGGLSLALSGVPFWSHDIGGFYGDVKDEVFARWAQFGLFSSHSRLHGTTSRRPWEFGKRACEIVVDYIKLRYRLMPYILKTAKRCSEEGMPFIRPLIMEHEKEPGIWSISDQYYFGEDIMVAPVFGGDNTQRHVYLPEGEWQDLLTGDQYQGKQWITLMCKLEYMPIFIKNHAEIGLLEKPDLYFQSE